MPPTAWGDKVVNGDWMQALFDPVVNLIGLAPVVVVAGGAIAAGLWSWSRSWTLMATWLSLFSGVVLTRGPPRLAFVGWLILAVGLTAGFYGVITGE